MPSTARQHRITAVKPITVPTASSGAELHVKVTAPVHGSNLPVIVFSHGVGWSMDAYQPLADRWAAAGFVVVQPTHPDSRRHRIAMDDPRFPGIWRTRISELHAAVDHLGAVLEQAGDLHVRTDRDRIALVGHSWGGQSAGTLLGARVLDAHGEPGEDFSHTAVSAGALIATNGTGESLTPFAAQHLPFMRSEFSAMNTATLVVAGGKDQSPLSTRGPEWFTDAYHLSPGARRLVSITAGEHTLGGIAGEGLQETTDEEPSRVALVAEAVAAHLLDVLTGEPTTWRELRDRRLSSVEAYEMMEK